MLKISFIVAFAAPLASAALAQAPQIPGEGEYVSVSGVVARAEDDSFWIDYGGGSLEVEFDEDLLTDLDLEDRLSPGERVVVYGTIDDEWFSEKSIEADAVYVPGRSTWYDSDITPVVTSYYYYFVPPDESVATGAASADVSFTGEVRSVDERMFTLDAGESELRVDTTRMDENPFDGEGYPKIGEGDRVMVTGQIDQNLFSRRVLRADEVLSVAPGASSSKQTAVSGAAEGNKPQAGYYGTDGASSSRENSAERMVENRTAMNDRATGPDVDGTEGDMAQNPVFLAMDSNENGEISEKEYVKFVQRPANISKDEARKFFDVTAKGDDAISPMELFSLSEHVDRVSEKVTDRNR